MNYKRGGVIIAVAILVIIIFLFYKKRDVPQYKVYESPNGNWKSLTVRKYINDINYTATEVPLQYYLLKNNTNAPEKVALLAKELERERIVEVEFQHTNGVDLLLDTYTNRSYEASVKYMAFGIEKDFSVVTSSNDTIACSGVNFERNFKLAPFKRILLYFNGIAPEDKIKLLYEDRLFGNGIMKFNFGTAPLKL